MKKALVLSLLLLFPVLAHADPTLEGIIELLLLFAAIVILGIVLSIVGMVHASLYKKTGRHRSLIVSIVSICYLIFISQKFGGSEMYFDLFIIPALMILVVLIFKKKTIITDEREN